MFSGVECASVVLNKVYLLLNGDLGVAPKDTRKEKGGKKKKKLHRQGKGKATQAAHTSSVILRKGRPPPLQGLDIGHRQKTLPTSIKEKRIPRAEAPRFPSSKRNKRKK
eukprot:1145603-Pelagomonas_calceolata.AAC.5